MPPSLLRSVNCKTISFFSTSPLLALNQLATLNLPFPNFSRFSKLFHCSKGRVSRSRAAYSLRQVTVSLMRQTEVAVTTVRPSVSCPILSKLHYVMLPRSDPSDPVRDLTVPQQEAERSGSRLQQWNLLSEITRISAIRKRPHGAEFFLRSQYL